MGCLASLLTPGCKVTEIQPLALKPRRYQFPVAAVTNYRTLSGLKQHKCILLRFWKPAGQREARWAAGVSWGVSPAARRGNLPFAFSASSCISWLLAFSSIFKGHHSNLLILSVIKYPSTSHLQDFVITFGATWRIQIISPPHILHLITSAMSLWPDGFSGIRTWTSLGDLYPAGHGPGGLVSVMAGSRPNKGTRPSSCQKAPLFQKSQPESHGSFPLVQLRPHALPEAFTLARGLPGCPFDWVGLDYVPTFIIPLSVVLTKGTERPVGGRKQHVIGFC